MPERTLEGVGDWTLFKATVKEIGLRRMMELVGWVALWEMQGYKTVAEARRGLEAQGYSKEGAYNAVRDIEKVRQILQEQFGREVTVEEARREIKELKLIRH